MPNYYAQIDAEGRVYAVSQLAGEVQEDHLIPINEEMYKDGRLLFTRYAQGKFSGSTAVLRGDKPAILADGQDRMKVEITVTDWRGELQKDLLKDLKVELGGMTQLVPLIDGTAEITISSGEPGTYVFRTIGLDRDAALKVVVQHGS